MVFNFKAVQIKWFATLAELDKIDVKWISFKRNNYGIKTN